MLLHRPARLSALQNSTVARPLSHRLDSLQLPTRASAASSHHPPTRATHTQPSPTTAAPRQSKSGPACQVTLPRNPEAPHYDLTSFLAHAARTGANPLSTTYLGTKYEYTTLSTLRRCGFELVRIGGRGDGGVDLVGFWHLPSQPKGLPLRVIVQCKKLKAKAGPNLIRELEGAFRGAPTGWRGEGTIAMLVSVKGATKGVRDAMGRSGVPMIWCMLETGNDSTADEQERTGVEGMNGEDEIGAANASGNGSIISAPEAKVRQMLWNKAASDLGIEGLSVVTRYSRGSKNSTESIGDQNGQEVVLMWQGAIVPEFEKI